MKKLINHTVFICSGILIFYSGQCLAQETTSTVKGVPQESSMQIDAFRESYLCESKKDFVKAIESLKKIYSDGSYEINLRLGWLSYLAGSYSESMTYYQKAIKNQPYAIEAKFGIIYPLAAQSNWAGVASQYEQILSIDPQNAIANYRLGYILYGKKEYEKAQKYFSKNVNLFPFSYDSLIMLAWCNLKLGKTREAKVLFTKVLMISPQDASAMEGLSQIK